VSTESTAVPNAVRLIVVRALEKSVDAVADIVASVLLVGFDNWAGIYGPRKRVGVHGGVEVLNVGDRQM
jgi:hypothetical protein